MNEYFKSLLDKHKYLRKTWLFLSGFLFAIGIEKGISDLLKLTNLCFCINPDLLKYLTYIFPITIGFANTLSRKGFSYRIEGTDTRVSCEICDILRQNGDIVISVNTSFDTSTKDDFVSPNSLQGKFQKKYFKKLGDTVPALDKAIEESLNREVPINVYTDGRNTKLKEYRVGTIAKISIQKGLLRKKFHSYLLALARSSVSGSACSTPEDFSLAINSLWIFLRNNGHKAKLNIPLIGTGRSKLNKERMTIAKEIMFSFVAFAKNSNIIDELNICISPYDYKNYNMNLDELDKYLNVICKNDSFCKSKNDDIEKLSTPVP